MKRLIDWFRSKLSFRISLWIVLFAAIVFISTFRLLFVRISDAVQGEAVSRATQILDKTSLQVEGILNRVEVATDMTAPAGPSHI